MSDEALPTSLRARANEKVVAAQELEAARERERPTAPSDEDDDEEEDAVAHGRNRTRNGGSSYRPSKQQAERICNAVSRMLQNE